jgi:hypothetical protein
MKALGFTIGLLCAALYGCTTIVEVPQGPKYEDFKVFASPRSFDPPGRVYRVQPDGQVFGVVTLQIKPQSGVEAIPRIETRANFSLTELLETVGVAAEELPASVSAEIKRKREVTFEGLDAKREFLDDADLDKVLPKALADVRIRPDNKYYIIRETISSEDVNYKMEKSWILNAGFEAQFKSILKNKAKLDWDSGEIFSINKKFSQPLRIWYKAESLSIDRPLGMGPGQLPSVERRPLTVEQQIALPPDAPTNP